MRFANKKVLWTATFVMALFSFWLKTHETTARFDYTNHRELIAIFTQDSADIIAYEKLFGIKIDSTVNLKMLGYISEWLGTPYRSAGMSKSGTDCSGFVMKVYKEVFGVDLVHSSAGMIRQVDQRVKKAELKAGDLLFFKINGRSISHVGIYLNDNKFVHASGRKGVVVDDLNEPYYVRTYYAAGRIINSLMAENKTE